MTLCIIINSIMALLFMVVVAWLVLVIRSDRQNDRAEAIIRDQAFRQEMRMAQDECHKFNERVIDKVAEAFKTLGHSLDENTTAMGRRDATVREQGKP